VDNALKPQRPQRSTLRTQKKYPHKDITEKIISCAIKVHTTLGPGLFEKLYEEAMEHELKSRGIEYERQKSLNIEYLGKTIGNYRLDFLIEKRVIVELKCVQSINSIHVAQILTYLKAEHLKVGLLINFNVDILKNGIRRIIA
jgi:GxxExxY protein